MLGGAETFLWALELIFSTFTTLEAIFLTNWHIWASRGTRLDRLKSAAWYPFELYARDPANGKNSLECVLFKIILRS